MISMLIVPCYIYCYLATQTVQLLLTVMLSVAKTMLFMLPLVFRYCIDSILKMFLKFYMTVQTVVSARCCGYIDEML